MTLQLCVTKGLNVDVDGALFVDLCTDGGLTTDPATGCLKLLRQDLVRVTIRHDNAQLVPATVGSCVTSPKTQIDYDSIVGAVIGPAVVSLLNGASSITVNRAGTYLITASQGDNPTTNGTNTTLLQPDKCTSGLEVLVNGVIVINSRFDRINAQTDFHTVSRVIDLVIGDVVTTQWTMHNWGGTTAPHALNGHESDILQVVQLPRVFVSPTA